MQIRAFQINLQPHFGGGEVYTAFLCRALSRLGVPTRLFVHPDADFWSRLALPPETELIAAASTGTVVSALSDGGAWLIGHGPLRPELVAAGQKRGAVVTAFAHMPVQGRNPTAFAGHDKIFAVSGWVLDGLRQAGLPAWESPLYGVAELTHARSSGVLRRTSRYDWDRRKLRDRTLAWLEPFVEPWRAHPAYERRPSLTLGIVSRLTPIKQFPLLFRFVAPVLADMSEVNVEIFGSGGYGSVRDLSAAVAPLEGRVRFWGHQRDVGSVYDGIDYLLTGLPEKEALGLNVIEAQACGTPVLAPAAPPFTETVVDGATGFLYVDPRKDGGVDFRRVVSELRSSTRRPDPRLATDHLARFSMQAFVERLKPVVAWVGKELSS